ncbi:unnamed protein product [Bursaphelenchus okinawaensis]|uniref:Uncharacterized protein n=1 Tax=Bursaphelenchus okinawaensis TaxID=465554 RepID=A0A811L787_9BILA|nr:unnamed protein product [Bursaphelenchus okinawaensis]CAG9119277.1 unnamed protein product [Bursaphelenchus okinawaensis]
MKKYRHIMYMIVGNNLCFSFLNSITVTTVDFVDNYVFFNNFGPFETQAGLLSKILIQAWFFLISSSVFTTITFFLYCQSTICLRSKLSKKAIAIIYIMLQAFNCGISVKGGYAMDDSQRPFYTAILRKDGIYYGDDVKFNVTALNSGVYLAAILMCVTLSCVYAVMTYCANQCYKELTLRRVHMSAANINFHTQLSKLLLVMSEKEEKVRVISNRNWLTLSSIEYDPYYCLIPEYWKPDPLAIAPDSITLVTHSAVEFVDFIDEHLKTWTGPISMALIVPNPMHVVNVSGMNDIGSDDIVNYAFSYSLAKLELLKAKKSNLITLSLLYQRVSECYNTLRVPLARLKADPELVTDTYNTLRRFSGYPANYLRNIATKGSPTNLIFQTEIENLPSEGFEKALRPLANELLVHGNRRKTLLIVPEFESSLGLEIPRNKLQLREMYNNDDVVEAYTKRSRANNHRIPYLERWMEHSDVDITPFKVIPYQGNRWEPSFIAHRSNLPSHPELLSIVHQDARFQVEEACRDGFDFVIINNLFTVHAGFRKIVDQMIDGAKNDTMRIMLNNYKVFKESLDLLYPINKFKCPEKAVEHMI